jgi:putative addiction module component (TIGR02574 family)
MHLTADQIEVEALSLPRRERARLVDALLASLESDPDVERAWDEEIRRRIRDIDAGVTKLIPGDEVLKEVEDVERAWDEEVDRRHRAFLAGEISSVPAKEALAQLRRRLVE